jgi:hypothetical protein
MKYFDDFRSFLTSITLFPPAGPSITASNFYYSLYQIKTLHPNSNDRSFVKFLSILLLLLSIIRNDEQTKKSKNWQTKSGQRQVTKKFNQVEKNEAGGGLLNFKWKKIHSVIDTGGSSGR